MTSLDLLGLKFKENYPMVDGPNLSSKFQAFVITLKAQCNKSCLFSFRLIKDYFVENISIGQQLGSFHCFSLSPISVTRICIIDENLAFKMIIFFMNAFKMIMLVWLYQFVWTYLVREFVSYFIGNVTNNILQIWLV